MASSSALYFLRPGETRFHKLTAAEGLHIRGFTDPWGNPSVTAITAIAAGRANEVYVGYQGFETDGNPYLALSAAIASGLWGIEHKLEPTEPIAGNAYERKHPAKHQLPRSLTEAAERLHGSKAARALFGDAFVEHYAATREWEEREARKHITDWELYRYFEII